jgi:hypothetical protein
VTSRLRCTPKAASAWRVRRWALDARSAARLRTLSARCRKRQQTDSMSVSADCLVSVFFINCSLSTHAYSLVRVVLGRVDRGPHGEPRTWAARVRLPVEAA